MTRAKVVGRANEIMAIGALADPVRRELYDYIAAQNEPVSREVAAEAAGILSASSLRGCSNPNSAG